MLKAIIIDDEENAIRSLELIIGNYVSGLTVCGKANEPELGIELINQFKPDIVFLDIHMPSMNGFEVLEKLEHQQFQLVFTTAHQEYVLKAIKQAAAAYLLKPIDPEELQAALTRIRKKIEEKEMDQSVLKLLKEFWGFNTTRVTLPSRTKIEVVTPAEILWIEADSNDCRVALMGADSMHVSRSLKEFEAQLCLQNLYFMRIHNSFIINLNQVERFYKEDGGYVIMKDKKKIPISKQKKEEFMRTLL